MHWFILILIVAAIVLILRNEKKRVKAKEKTPVSKDSQFELSDGFLSIHKVDFYGPYSSSDNGQYIIAWSNFNSVGRTPGKNKKIQGKFLLAKDSEILFTGEMEYPNHGKVANNGTFIINNSKTLNDSEDTSPTMHVFSSSQESLIEMDSYYGVAISDDGEYVLCYHHKENMGYYDENLVIVDIKSNSTISRITPIARKSKDYRILPDEQVVCVAYDQGIEHRYSFDGTFLDEKRWKNDRLILLSGYDLLSIAEKELKAINSQEIKAYSDIIKLLDTALKKGISDNTQARIHRYLGEIYHQFGNKNKSIEHLKKALELNPKVGVKKLYEKLKKS